MALRDTSRRRLILDEDTAERLIRLEVEADDAPPAYAPVARVLHDAVAEPQPSEQAGEDQAIAMFVAERAARASAAVPVRRRLVVTARAAVAAAAGALVLTGGIAAATTGHLPDSVQGAAHDTLSHIGITIPDVPAPAPPGQEIRTTAQDPATSGSGKGAAVCAEASADRCQPGAGDQGNSGPGNGADPSAKGSGNGADPSARDHTPPSTTPAGPPAGVTPGGPPDSVPDTTTTTRPTGPPADVPNSTRSVPQGTGHSAKSNNRAG